MLPALDALSALSATAGRRVRVLVVAPRFAPSNAPDSHRVRLLLPHLAAAGFDVDVLAVDPRDVGAPVDAWLEERLPAGVPVHRVRAWPLRGWGTGGLAQRALVPLYRRGSALLSQQRFDLVCFSTTEFLLHLLGPAWQSRHRVPFVMDLQDPWVNDYYSRHGVVPPGGRLKHAVAAALHGAAERSVVPRAAGLLSVSAAYLQDLSARHGIRTSRIPSLVEPFPAEPSEMEGVLRSVHRVPARALPCDTGFVWRYIGIAGPYMSTALSVFFEGWRLALQRAPGPAGRMRLETIGTTYAQPGHRGFRSTVAPIAERAGLGGLVTEAPGRIGYRDMLGALSAADGLVVFGSDDSTYSASKLYPYLLAERPLVVICHRESPMVEVMNAARGGVCIPFDPTATSSAVERVAALLSVEPRVTDLDRDGLAPFTAAAQAARVAGWIRASVLKLQDAVVLAEAAFS